MNITIDKDFKNIFPKLHKEEYARLEQSILTEGCREPLILWNGILIDGHNRYEICQKHNVHCEFRNMEFKSREDVTVWMINTQVGRRNLSAAQRIELALLSESLIREKARKNMSLGGGDKKSGTQETSNPIENIVTRQQVAQLAGVSHDTVKKFKVVKEKASPEVLAEVMAGEKKIGKAYREIQTKANTNEQPQTKICSVCQKEKPIEDFYTGKKSCKSCCINSKTYRDIKGNVIKSNPETNRLFKEKSEEMMSIRDSSRIIEYTMDDLAEELQGIVRYFSRNIFNRISEHAELLRQTTDKQKITTVLLEAETAINKIRKDYLL